MKSKVALAVAIALAVLAAVGIHTYLRRETQRTVQTRKTVSVLVAVKPIRKGVKLTGDMVIDKEVDQFAVQDGRTLLSRDAERVLGQTILADVHPGEPLLWSHLKSESSTENPASGLTPGYRQITIPVDKVTGCAGRLLPGTMVDVIATLRVRRESGSAIDPVTQTVLTSMRVVATDLNVQERYEFLSARERRDFAAYSTVTLRALPLQANLLAFLTEQGKLHLVIRGPDDPTGQDPSKLDKVSLDNLDALMKKASDEKPPAIKAPEH